MARARLPRYSQSEAEAAEGLLDFVPRYSQALTQGLHFCFLHAKFGPEEERVNAMLLFKAAAWERYQLECSVVRGVSTSIDDILSGGRFAFGEDAYMPFDAFKKVLKAESMGDFDPPLVAIEMSFARYGLRVERRALPYDGLTLTRDYVMGCDAMM